MTAYLKALYGAVVAGLGATSTAYAQGHGHIGWQAIIFIVTVTVTAFGVVWGVPNAAPTTDK
jgi:hypothetical protein